MVRKAEHKTHIQRVYIDNKLDIDNVVVALTHNNYTVRVSREKASNNRYRHYVEFWRDEL